MRIKRALSFVLCFVVFIVTLFLSSCAEHDHIFGDWYTKREPTCDTDGINERKCNCGKVEREKIPSVFHVNSGACEECDPVPSTEGVVYRKAKDGQYAEVTRYNGDELHVVIASEFDGLPVRKICNGAFEGVQIRSLLIPESVTEIEVAAVVNAYALQRLIIRSNLTLIPESMVAGCKMLTTVDIPDSVSEIGIYAFRECVRLAEIDLPKGLKKIGYNAFQGCESLETVYIPDGVESIGEWAFCECDNLTEVRLPDSITEISNMLFRSCGALKSVNIPESVTRLGDQAFYGCDSLTGITLPEGITSVGYMCFSSCDNLIELTLPDSLTAISDEMFRGCTNLITVHIGSGVKSIGIMAFDNCHRLAYIHIPSLVFQIFQRLPDIWILCPKILTN